MLSFMDNELERNVLRSFFDTVSAMEPLDNSISESKLVRDTKNKLKVALRGATQRCSCAKRRYGICEVCQASGEHMHTLRTFYRMMQKAKKFNWSNQEMADYVKNYKERLG